MIDCYIVDDDKDAIGILEDYITSTPGLNLAFSSTVAQDILPFISRPARPVIAFLDIQMPLLSGLDLAGMAGPDTAIVFVTAFEEYAMEAFRKNAWDYLLKPVAYADFFKTYHKVRKSLSPYHPAMSEESRRFVFFSEARSGYQRIFLDDIIYVEMMENYARIFLSNGKHILYNISLRKLNYQLASNRFMQVHKSYLINLQKISYFTGHRVLMEDKQEIPVGDAYRQALVMKLYEFTIRAQRGK